MTLTRREKVLIIFGSIIVAAALYLVYFLMPYLQSSSDAGKTLADTRTQLSTLNMKAAGVAKLDEEISQLKNELETQWASVPVGIDHARILLYLKGLTDGRAENIRIAVPEVAAAEGPFLAQTFTLDFNTTYDGFLKILGDLKKNELYNRAKLIKADYQPVPIEAPAGAPAGTEPAAAPTASPVAVDKNVIAVHMELAFYALQPAGSAQPAPAMTPTNANRTNSLMPAD